MAPTELIDAAKAVPDHDLDSKLVVISPRVRDEILAPDSARGRWGSNHIRSFMGIDVLVSRVIDDPPGWHLVDKAKTGADGKRRFGT